MVRLGNIIIGYAMVEIVNERSNTTQKAKTFGRKGNLNF